MTSDDYLLICTYICIGNNNTLCTEGTWQAHEWFSDEKSPELRCYEDLLYVLRTASLIEADQTPLKVFSTSIIKQSGKYFALLP